MWTCCIEDERIMKRRVSNWQNLSGILRAIKLYCATSGAEGSGENKSEISQNDRF